MEKIPKMSMLNGMSFSVSVIHNWQEMSKMGVLTFFLTCLVP